MSKKIFDIKGIGGIVGILLPVVIGIINQVVKKEPESLMLDRCENSKKITQNKR
jgi:hypothetical protein